MNKNIRIATQADAHAFIRIKNQLSFKNITNETTKGGFLLGTSLENYQFYIENSYCLVAEIDNEIVGFGILFADAIVRQSDIWQRRNQAHWEIEIESFENKKISYFEQIAFMAGNQKLAIKLAYELAKWSFKEGHDCIFTTTVNKPIKNLAAVGFIKSCGGKWVGSIDEHYAEIGALKSDIYCIEANDFSEKTSSNHPLANLLFENEKS